MNIAEALVYLFVFVCMYGGFLLVAWAVDKILRRLIGKGIFPEGYFKW